MALLKQSANSERVRRRSMCRAAMPRWLRAIRGLVPLTAALFVIFTSEGQAKVSAGAPSSSEAEITAAFIINFARFTEWPPRTFADANSPITVGFLGAEDIRAALQSFAGDKELNGRKVIVRQVDSAADSKSCQVVYIANAKAYVIAEILKGARDSGTLTIAASEDFLGHGGMIRLFVKDEKMKFDVNLGPANAANIRLSSRLLALARNIVDLPDRGAN